MQNPDMHLAARVVMRHEGVRLYPYRDTVGKLTIGVGRNLDDVGISEEEAQLLLRNDLTQISAELAAQPWFSTLDRARRLALIDMGFNLGLPRLLQFKRMIAALEAGDWQRAADEMLDSRWAAQVGARARELAAIVQSGTLPEEASA